MYHVSRGVFSLSLNTGHLSRCWFELVPAQAIVYLDHHLGHSALSEHRCDFLGLKQILQSNRLIA